MNEIKLPNVELTRSEENLLKSCSRFKITLAYSILLVAIMSLIWLKYFHQLAPNEAALGFNLIAYVGFAGASFEAVMRQKRTHNLFQKIKKSIESNQGMEPAR